MNILTSQDAALVSCCDCQTPQCPAPRRECQSLTGVGYLHGFVNDNLPREQWYETLYKNLRQEYADGGHWYTYEWNTIIEARLGGKLVSDPMVRSDSHGGPETYAQPITATYSGGVTFAEAVAEMSSLMEAAVDWNDQTMTKGGGCTPARIENFLEFTVGGYRPHDFSMTFVRHRIGVPEGFSTPAAPRTYFEVQWDEVFFPEQWDAWKALKDAYDEAVARHDAWEACEAATPGWCGEEPDIPDAPGTSPSPAPSLVATRNWIWSGSMEDPWSEWFEIPMPQSPGGIRVVNMLVKCFRDTKRGVKPSAHGEVHEMPA